MAVAERPALGQPYRFTTHAIGTWVELVVTDPAVLVAAVDVLHEELDRIDAVASRFRDDSEISRLQRAHGPAWVSPDLMEAIRVALRVAEATEGAVDPTVGAAMCDLGYDRDFLEIAGGVKGTLPPPRPVPGWRSIEIDAAAGTVVLPRGVVLDLGASAKALTSDRVADRIAATFGCGVAVSLGGDVAVAGPAPEGGFPIGIPAGSGTATRASVISITSGGVATSGLGVRTWPLGDELVHHIVDPATGLPVPPVWELATVVAGSCVDANAAATAAIVKGHSAPAWLAGHGLPSRLVGNGAVEYVGAWPAEDPGVPVDEAPA